MAFAMAEDWSVNIVLGAFPPIIATNVLKAHSKFDAHSVVNRTPPNITDWK